MTSYSFVMASGRGNRVSRTADRIYLLMLLPLPLLLLLLRWMYSSAISCSLDPGPPAPMMFGRGLVSWRQKTIDGL